MRDVTTFCFCHSPPTKFWLAARRTLLLPWGHSRVSPALLTCMVKIAHPNKGRNDSDEAETLTRAGLVKKESKVGVGAKIYSAALGAGTTVMLMVFVAVRPDKPPCLGRTVGKDAAPAIFATRRISPESTVTPVREMVWK